MLLHISVDRQEVIILLQYSKYEPLGFLEYVRYLKKKSLYRDSLKI